NATLHAAYAGVLTRSTDAEAAIDEVRKAVDLDPQNPVFRTSLATIYLQEPGYINEAIATYEGALKADPNFRLAQLGLDRANGQKTHAMDEAANARRMAQQNASSGSYLALGVGELLAGNLDASNIAVQKSVEMNPKNGRAHASLARVRYLKK